MNLKLKDRVDYLLQEWVGINSHSKNELGVNKVLYGVEAELKEMKLPSQWIVNESSDERNAALLAKLPATGPNAQSAPTITLLCHADTTFPEDSPFQSVTFSADRNRAIGPGVADGKGGILVALLALERISQLEKRRLNLQFLCMPAREIGSPGFADFFERMSIGCSCVLGFEPALPDGSVIHARKGTDECPAFLVSRAGESFSKFATQLILKYENRKVTAQGVKTASDCNYLYREGMTMLDGLGPVGTGHRTNKETVEMKSIFTRAQIAAELILHFADHSVAKDE